ncbi:MAG TPA: amino acid adenylation domain-containing protein, partial [Ktedonobacteraceae bacterium]
MNPFSRRDAGISQRKRALLDSLLQQEGLKSSPHLALYRRQNNDFLPLSFAQQRLWFLDQWEQGSPVYTISRAFSLSGPLNLAALARSIDEIIGRHEALRTTFELVDRQPVQIIAPALTGILRVIDLTELSETEKETTLQRLASAEFRSPFDLAQGPLIRVQLLRLSLEQHILLLSVHHIICDGWSLSTLLSEISLLYQAYAAAQPSPLPALPLQYADYALWQHAWLQGERLETQLSYWRKHLKDAPTVLELPADRARTAVQTFQGTHYTYALSPELSADLLSLSRQADTTLFMTLLAAFATLLQRYSGQQDLVIGTPIANRSQAQLKNLIGCFVNTLALRITLPGASRFVDLLAHVRELCLDAYAHQDLPFERLVEGLTSERDLSHLPLFQVMFALQNQPGEELHLSGLTVHPSMFGDTGTARMDLMLTIIESRDSFQMDFEYNTHLFEAATIERMAVHFQQLLAGIVRDPQQQLSRLPLLSETERQHMLVDWHVTEAPSSAHMGIHQLLEAQVERTPDAIALIVAEEHLTYCELNRRANRLAHYLRQCGVGPEVPVALCLPRNLDLLITLLAILKAGGAYVPLDPRYPLERLTFMLAEARVRLLVTHSSWLDQHPLPLVSCLCLDTLQDQLNQCGETNLRNTIDAENLAYVIYTSGSTGQPKGVGIAHRNTLALLHWAQNRFPLELLKGVLASTSVCFDLSIFEFFLPLSCGGTVLLIEDVLQLPDMPAASAVTLLNTVPSVLATLLLANHLPSSVHTVTLAGEALPDTLVQQLYEREGIQQVYNLYGPSEDTTYSTWARVPAGTTEPVSIGRPIANTRAYVLDAQLQPVPPGIVGELYLGGEGLARGYLQRPALTAERFVPHPWSSEPGARLYRTGDLARYQSGGDLQFVGRSDGQVKMRGYRIELGEIEAILRAQPRVRDAVVLLREDRPGDRRMVSYIVPQPQEAPTSSQLRAHLARKLPDYMLPDAFVLLEQLPLSPHGKLDRRALPAPAPREESAQSYGVPQTPLEEILAEIWAEVLGLERVGTHDNFFALGGHSLLATRAVARLREALQREIPLRSLFEAPTIARLAQYLTRTLFSEPQWLLPPLQTVPRPVNLPLAFAQQRLWFIDQLQPTTAAYTISMPLRLDGTCYVKSLEKALSEIVRRHEILRTTFTFDDTAPIQRIALRLPLDLPVVDLSTLPVSQREMLARQLANTEARQPFDLARGPLLRASLFRLREDRHILLLTMHHIIVDGWSLGVLLRELSTLYRDFALEQPPTLPELPLQYADYALWQQNWLQGAALEAQLAYWKQQLQDAPLRLELPTDRPRPAVQTYQGAHHAFTFSQELSSALVTLSRREGATLFMTLLAGWQILLSRYSGQSDLLVGTPIANRSQRETEALIGCFINTLVLRGNLSGNPDFLAVLRQVRETTLGAYAHQDLPFEQLVEALHPHRDLSHTPLFQVMFVLQNIPSAEVALPGLRLSLLPIEQEIARFELTLIMQETEHGLRGMLEYNTDLFETGTIMRMAEHYQRLLEAIVSNPRQSVSHLPMLTEQEEQLLLSTWNATEVDFPREHCWHQLFEAQVERTPEAIALSLQDEQLSYQELNTRANRLARRLQSSGVEPDMRVGVGVERGLDMVIGLLAVLKAGGVYVPLDPTFPAERLSFLLADSRVALLLTQPHLLERWPREHIKVLFLPGDEPNLAAESESNPLRTVTPRHLAYMIYTSGSTGLPKGVMIAHQGLSNLAEAQIQAFHVQPGDRILQFASLNFDASIWEMVMALRVGATLCLTTPESQLPGPDLVRHLQEQAITVMTLSPSALSIMPVAAFPALHTLIAAGETCSAELVATWAAGRRFFNAYGPTETTVCATIYECQDNGRRPAIGRPTANTQVYVLDHHLQPVPAGIAGELYIGGQGVARGYLQRPELTAERFIPNPFGLEKGSRLYKTGDWARYLSDGTLEFLGRQDQQVKLRGYRIELEELESVLVKHPGVQEAAVMVREDVPGDQRLVAYVVASERQRPTLSELRTYLQARLPDYMLPAAFLLLDALPLTHNGKLDRRALPAYDDSASAREEAYVAPRSPGEEMLAAIWADVLRLERVGTHDHFFELGGHSLLATQVIARIREAWRVELPLRALFEAPTVAALAGRLEMATQTEQGLPVPSLQLYPRAQDLPLSFAQQRLWFLAQLDPQSALYNAPFAFSLRGNLHPAALARSLQELVRRHETLRTTFDSREGQPLQHIHAHLAISLPCLDLSALPEPTRSTQARALIQQEALTPFDLEHGPLLRACLLRLDPEEHLLLLTMHHIASDAWSLGVLRRELATLYTAFSAGQPSALPPLPLQYADYALWQRQWLLGAVLHHHLAYWQHQLAGAPDQLDLPTDHPRHSRPSFQGASLPFQVPAPLTSALKALSLQQGATLFMTLFAAFSLLLSRLSGQDDLLVGTPIANRRQRETEDLIGFFVNTLVLRADLSGDPGFLTLLGRTRETLLGAYAHQDLPFEQLVEALHPRRELSQTPLVQVLFLFQNVPLEEMSLPDLHLAPVPIAQTSAKMELTLFLQETDQGLRGMLEYQTDLFEPATIARLVSSYLCILEAVATSPELPLSHLPWLPAVVRDQLLFAWNATEAPEERQEGLHQLFEQQVERAPDAIALVYEDEHLTYAELNARANRLAHYLHSLNIRSEDVVTLCLQRSLPMVVGLLAVLKAGGAYLLLDPGNPLERLAFIIRDARAVLLLTQAQLVQRTEMIDVPILYLEREEPALAALPASNARWATWPENQAYVIYTSGSTGKPKGIQNTHRGLVNLLRWHQKTFALSAADRASHLAGLGFDAASWELWPYLISGASVSLVDERIRAWPKQLRAWILEQAITVSFFPTPLAEQMVLLSWPQETALRTMLVGGDRLHQIPVSSLPFAVVNNYGPSEYTVVATSGPVVQEKQVEVLPAIGRPIANTQVYVLDRHLQPVAVGVVGELYLGGAGLARGYFNDTRRTAERFLPDPFSTQTGARLYRTGDMVRYRPDGGLDFVGRADQQVKLRGYRIELGEIEAVLQEYQGIQACVAVLQEDSRQEKRLVAYVETGEQPLKLAQLRAWLIQHLPDYMVPSALILLAQLPLSPNGKVDRRALPVLQPDQFEREEIYVAPGSPLEEIVAAIWSEVLKVEQVGLYDNFFALGGHSLIATQVIARLRNILQIEIPLRLLFEAPTVDGIARQIERLSSGESILPVPPLSPAPRARERELPLSFAQQRLWFLAQLDPQSALYNAPFAFSLRGNLHPAAL